MANHYSILDVAPSATAEEIRNAYLRLIKLYHPDAPGPQDPNREEKAQELNRAYSVLRDRAKRAEYDAALGLRRRPAPAPGGVPIVLASQMPLKAPPRKSGGLARLAVLAATALIGGLLGVLLVTFFESEPRLGGVAVAAEPGSLADESKQPPIDTSIVLNASAASEFLFLHGSPAEAAGLSRNCFSALAHAPTLQLLDRCVAFDLASRRWSGITKRERQTRFFADPAMEARHRTAFRRLGFDDQAAGNRVNKLNQLTVTDVVLRLGRP
ncbi:MAG: J domain-containing protein [Pseudomonadota bacterium]|nr:J domain-containing protein [Pseudomonadota bacterium]